MRTRLLARGAERVPLGARATGAPAVAGASAGRALAAQLALLYPWPRISTTRCAQGRHAMATDPYAAPRARVADAPAIGDDRRFIPEGNAVPAGNGWQWFVGGWELFKQQPGMWVGMMVVLFIAMLVVSWIPLLNVAVTLFGPVVAGGLLLGCAALRRGEELSFSHVTAAFQEHLGRLIVLGLLALGAGAVIGILLALGVGLDAMRAGSDPGYMAGFMFRVAIAALVALALSVPIYMALWFAPALVVFNGLQPIAAVKASFAACLKNIVPFLIYGVIGLALAFVATIPLGLGWLVLAPVLVGSIYAGYRDIFYGD
jgi:uncharacterized membrane protein